MTEGSSREEELGRAAPRRPASRCPADSAGLARGSRAQWADDCDQLGRGARDREQACIILGAKN